jgi:predicted RNA-binding protein
VVYVKERAQSEPGERVFADAAHIECREGEVVVTGLFGECKSLEGEVRSIDLVNNQVILER